MTASHGDETRTKLSSKATPFRPIVPSVGSSSTITSGPLAYSSESVLDSSTGSVGSWANGHMLVAIPLPTTPACGWSNSTSFSQDGRGSSWSPQIPERTPLSGKGEFKLGDFSSNLLKRAQTQTSQETSVLTRVDPGFAFENSWSGDAWIKQALMVESFAAGRASAVRGSMAQNATSERRKAMHQAMQRSLTPEPELSERERGVPAVPAQHAATFNEAISSQQESKESKDPDALPVKRTFIHFSDDIGPKDSGFQWSSAPAIMMTCEHRTKYPEMEAAHIRGECRPCFYNTKKSDGCRHGAECEFCHLCPVGSVQKKRKEKNRVLKEAEDRARRRELRRPGSFSSTGYDSRS